MMPGRWRALVVLVLLVATVLVLTSLSGSGARAPARTARSTAPRDTPHWTPSSWLASLEAAARGQPGHLQPGSDPSVLPGPVLIADRNNSRLLLVDQWGRVLWQFPAPGDLAPGTSFLAPDDAFFGPRGRHVLVTQESDMVISELSLRTSHIVWQYGHPGVPGSEPGYLSNPDDAMLLPNGDVMLADIKNCRLLELARDSLVPLRVYGTTTPFCYHAPPGRFGSPNGVFPMTNGDWLVTEINGDWLDEMTPSGAIVWSMHPPGISYPSDTNEVSPGVYLTTSYSDPGVVEEFTSSGQVLWRYAPSGAQALDQPSLALPLPNGDVLVNDDWNDRVIVIDPRDDQVVWQYGVTGVPGSAPGLLFKPDGVDLAPPYSLDVVHAATMGVPLSTGAGSP